VGATEAASSSLDVAEYHGLTLETRKRLGIFYTPNAIAEILVEWALPAAGPVIDPSFGGCSFLGAAVDRLEQLGASNAAALVHGVDIDEVGARFSAASVLARGVPPANIRFGDFFGMQAPNEETARYAAVVGNPPYIRACAVDAEVSESAQRALAGAQADLPRTASLWAPFTVHSVQHVRRGGRLVFLLPSSLLHAAYSRRLLTWICERFGRVRLIEIGEPVFSDVQEDTIVLACEGAGGHTTMVDYVHIRRVSELRANLSRDGVARQPPTASGWWKALAPPESVAVLTELESTAERVVLGDCCDLRIGVVTGANAFFVRPYDRKLAQYLRPVVARSGWLKSPLWTSADVARHRQDGSKSWLLTLPPSDEPPRSFVTDVIRAEVAKLDERRHCLRREPWWSLSEVRVPDLFLPYMNGGSPALTKNETRRATSTNAVHRLYWKDRSRADSNLARRDTLVASSWTSAFSLAAELLGRHYGGGVLKLEPSEASGLPLFDGGKPELLAQLDAVARRSGRSAAQRLADDLILRRGLGLDRGDVEALSEGVTVLQSHRRRVETAE
jgi:adenine-specific DNA-methyltransferase